MDVEEILAQTEVHLHTDPVVSGAYAEANGFTLSPVNVPALSEANVSAASPLKPLPRFGPPFLIATRTHSRNEPTR